MVNTLPSQGNIHGFEPHTGHHNKLNSDNTLILSVFLRLLSLDFTKSYRIKQNSAKINFFSKMSKKVVLLVFKEKYLLKYFTE